MSAPHRAEPDGIDWSSVGRRIRELRIQRGLTQPQVSANHFSVAYLSRIEAGQRRPDQRILEHIATMLGTTSQQLLTGVGDDQAIELTLRIRYAELALNSGEASDAISTLDPLLHDGSPLTSQQREDVIWTLALARQSIGQYSDAIRLLELVSSHRFRRHPAEVAIALAGCYRESGDLSRAIDVAAAGLADCEKLGLADSDEAIQLLVTLAGVHIHRGDLALARSLCDDAVSRADGVGNKVTRASAYWNASIVAVESNDHAAALALAERALALLSESDDHRRLARLRLLVGLMLLHDDHDPERAHDELLCARQALAESGASASDLSRCDTGLAVAMLARGEIDQAGLLAAQALKESQGAPLAAAEAEVALGRIAFADGDRIEARTRFANAAACLSAAQADREIAQFWFQLADLHDQAGDSEAARVAYRNAAAATGLRIPHGRLAPARDS